MAIEWVASLVPQTLEFTINHNNRMFESSLTSHQSIVGYLGDYWSCSMSFNNLTQSEQREITALVGRLKGMFGTVKVPCLRRYRTDNIGSPVVDSTGATLATTLAVTGVTPSTQVFSTGDYITINDELFEITDNATSNGLGDVTINLNKRIRSTITAGSTINYQTPYCVMRLDNNAHSLSMVPIFGSMNLSFREAI